MAAGLAVIERVAYMDFVGLHAAKSSLVRPRERFSRRVCKTGPTAMKTVSTEDPQFQSAIETCAATLRRMAVYKLDPALARRMRELGERKEFLNEAEHEELLALVDFAQKRTVEKLEAQVALDRLRTALPGMLSDA